MSSQTTTESSLYAQVVFERAVDMAFDYIIPAHLHSAVVPGTIVQAPFGERVLTGYVTAVNDTTSVKKLKEIQSVCGNQFLADTDLYKIALWMSEYYASPLGLVLKAIYPPYIRKKRRGDKVVLVSLAKNREDIIRAIDELGKNSVRQIKVLEYLIKKHRPFVTRDELRKSLDVDNSVFISLEKKKLIALATEQEIQAREGRLQSYKFVEPVNTISLTDDQQKVLGSVIGSIDAKSFQPIVLHGVTGSGKTEIYLRAIMHVIKQGNQAIMLIPEISLTPQTEERFRKRFGDLVAVFHSRLSDTERSKEWKKMSDGKAMLVVGARSAIFAPFKNLGIIVVDEEHERSYKQEESPRYNARDLAVLRAKIKGIPVILGSATPSLESMYNVSLEKYTLLELPCRVVNRSMPHIHLVDLQKEVREEKQYVVFSLLLRDKIRDRLEKGEQTILFLNRRGFSSMAMCEQCGYVFECRDCSVSLTYHKSVDKLICHFCEHMQPTPQYCTKCGSNGIKFQGMGTQRVERQLKALVPEARILRMDSDTTAHKNSHFELLGQFRRGKADILIGTQMIAKGLDFPRVTLVGVILAESSLHMPDFRAGESTFQLLTQVAGRAGRGEVPGEVVIQTFMSEHPAVVCAIAQDYHRFVKGELIARERLGYPPFRRFINIIVKSKDPKKGQWLGMQLVNTMKDKLPHGTVIKGPFPSVIHRKRGNYIWNILLTTNHVIVTNACIRESLAKCQKFTGVSVGIDVDPYYMC
ncbi:MAG: primosomal protein N' [Candidatus Auribacterota bacterium]|jgi:primosomal protein N' (replication factor Y)|nr:primosomal protein N' [Candidatus Auribacterota bacterium]